MEHLWKLHYDSPKVYTLKTDFFKESKKFDDEWWHGPPAAKFPFIS